MSFHYSKENLSKREQILQRILEILPGLTSWTILLGLITLSLLQPTLAAVFMIAFYLYWLMRMLYMTIFLTVSYYRLRVEQNTDWMKRVSALDDLEHYVKTFKTKKKYAGFKEWLSFSIHQKETLVLKRSKKLPPPSKDIYHLIIYPVIKESKEIIEPGIKSLGEQKFPTERMVVVFALEERAATDIKDAVLGLEKKYKDKFLEFLTVIHPSNIQGEARVKGANVTYAAKQAAQWLAKKNISPEQTIVSCFDADTVVTPHYFSCLTYYFMVSPHRLQNSFQPIPVYHNNIWDVPGFARVIETGSSFFQLVEATNPEKLVTFSSHSMSFKALTDADYWPVDMISDDSAIYWKCFIHFEGNYRVIPMYVMLSMDIAGSNSFWDTVKTVYKQKRRWAWGVENFPIVMRAFLKSKNIPLYHKIRLTFKLFEGHVAWATWGFVLSFIGWFPGLFAQQQYASSVIYYSTPRIAMTVFNLAAISLITSIIISISLLPKSKSKISWGRRIKHILEWITIPFIFVFFSALPALDAQTRLMLGKYMEFWVTDKKRK